MSINQKHSSHLSSPGFLCAPKHTLLNPHRTTSCTTTRIQNTHRPTHTSIHVHVRSHSQPKAAAVAFNVDRWQIKKTYWLNLSSSAAIHLRAQDNAIGFQYKMQANGNCKQRGGVVGGGLGFFLLFFFFIMASYSQLIDPTPNPPSLQLLPQVSLETARWGSKKD